MIKKLIKKFLIYLKFSRRNKFEPNSRIDLSVKMDNCVLQEYAMVSARAEISSVNLGQYSSIGRDT